MILYTNIQKEMDSICKIYQALNYNQHFTREDVCAAESFQIRLITEIRYVLTILQQMFMFAFLFYKDDPGNNVV